MKIQFLVTYSEGCIGSFYARNTRAADLSYREQLAEILDDHFGWPMDVAGRLGELGHEVEIIVTNARPLQRAWALENGIPWDEETFRRALPKLQVARFRPDIFWIFSMFPYYGEYLRDLAQHCRRVVAWIACPTPQQLSLEGIDLILSSHENLVDEFSRMGKKARRCLPSFEPRILDRLRSRHRDVPLSFVGGLSSAHAKRDALLRALVRHTPLLLWGYGRPIAPPMTGVRSALKRLRFSLDYGSLVKRHRGEVWGMEMYEVLRRSLMMVNMHIDLARGLAGNQRLFEGTGAGALVFTEDAPNLYELFVPGREVIAYTGAQDLIGKTEYYLAHDDERARVARAGQERTLSSHGTLQRARELETVFEDLV